MTSSPPLCRNCEAQLSGSFCSQCGQKATVRRLRLGELLRDGLSHSFSLDSTVTRTAIGLTRNPGRVSREYVEGKRVRYVGPLRYYLIVVAGMILINALVGFDPSTGSPIGDFSEAQLQAQEIAANFVSRHLDLVIFLVTPGLIVIFRLLFWKRPFNLAEVSVFVLFTMAQIFLLDLFLLPIRHFLGLEWPMPLRMAFQVGFLTWFAKVFFDTSTLATFLKSLLATALYLALLGVTVVLLVLPQMIPLIRQLKEGQG